MRPQDIVLNEYYRFRENPHYSYVKALEILRPKTKDNSLTYIVVRCEHTISKGDSFGFTRRFRPCDLIKDAKIENKS